MCVCFVEGPKLIGMLAAGALFLSVAVNSPPLAQAMKPKEYYDRINSKARKQCPDGLDPLRSDLIDEPPRIVCLKAPGPGVVTRPARHWRGFPGYDVVAYEIATSDGQLEDIAVSPSGSVFLAAGHTVVVKVDRGTASVVHKPYDAPISYVAGTCAACWFAVGQGDRARLGWFSGNSAEHSIHVAPVPNQDVGAQGREVWPDPSDVHQRDGSVWFIERQGRAVGRYAGGGMTIVPLYAHVPNGVVPLSGSLAAVPISCIDCILMVQRNQWFLKRVPFGDRINSIVPVGSRYWFLGDHAVGVGSLQAIHRVWNLARL